jgi:hypothetical protein
LVGHVALIPELRNIYGKSAGNIRMGEITWTKENWEDNINNDATVTG